MKYSKSKRFFIKSPRGFGYAIVDKGIGDKSNYKTLFYSSDREQTLEVFERIEDDHVNFPEPKLEFTPKLLKINWYSGDVYYLIRSLEELDDLSFNLLKECKRDNNFIKLDDSYSLIDDDYIESCPNDIIKDEMYKHNKLVVEREKIMTRRNSVIDMIENKLDNNSKKGSYSLLCECDFIYESVSLEDFKNL